MTPENELGFNTRAVHAGQPRPTTNGSVLQPIYQSATYEYFGEPGEKAVRYARLSNTPNHEALNEKLAALEGAEAAMVTASGMAAIATALLSLVGEGGHLLVPGDLYGATYQFLKDDYSSMGRKVTFFSLDRLEELESLVRPETKAIFVEAVSNPLIKIPDLGAILALAKRHQLLTFIDNTFPSPVNFSPIKMGFDVVVHSATKYLNGHSDIIAGCVLGRAAAIQQVARWLKHLGGSLDPHSCFLLDRGLKTLGVRVTWQNESALKLATALEKHPKIARVFYPGLASHPGHARASEWFRGFGGMLSFEHAGTVADTDRFLRRLTIPFVAPSLGGVETLVTRPALTSHSWLTSDQRSDLGLKDTLVRVSVGLEDTDDLINDFINALNP